MLKQVQDLCNTFFEMLQINVDSLNIKCEDKEKNIFYIDLKTQDSKLMIWSHWQTLESLKHILFRMIEWTLKKPFILHLEINDYIKLKDDKLYKYIDWRIDYVIKSKKDIVLPNFNAYERKKIHTYVSDKKIDWIKAYSQWEWTDRVMHISYNDNNSKKNNKLDLDIDWVEI